MDVFRRYYGPMYKAFQALDPLGQAALTKDLLALIATLNVATDGSMNVPSAHAEFVITKV